MNPTLLLSLLATLTSSASASPFFSLIAARSASPIHLQELAAANENLWIGKKTSTFCPASVRKQGGCPKGTHTNFAGGDGGLAMGTVVPGGQEVYIDRATGAVHYTVAHSADTEGGIVGGWTKTEGENFGHLSHPRGLFACSTTGDAETGPWQIYAKVKGVVLPEGCLGFDALTANETKAAAWQYT